MYDVMKLKYAVDWAKGAIRWISFTTFILVSIIFLIWVTNRSYHFFVEVRDNGFNLKKFKHNLDYFINTLCAVGAIGFIGAVNFWAWFM